MSDPVAAVETEVVDEVLVTGETTEVTAEVLVTVGDEATTSAAVVDESMLVTSEELEELERINLVEAEALFITPELPRAEASAVTEPMPAVRSTNERRSIGLKIIADSMRC